MHKHLKLQLIMQWWLAKPVEGATVKDHVHVQLVTSPRLCPPVATTRWKAPVTMRRTAALSAELSCSDLCHR